jgi:hypothetical protein
VVALWTLVEDLRITVGTDPVHTRHVYTPRHLFQLLPVAF